MKTFVPWLVGVVACAVLVVVLAPLFRSNASHTAGPAGLTGENAPVFALRDVRGHDVTLTQYRGRVVVMNLWSSYCPPCRAEMPDLQRFADEFARRGVVVVGVDQGESPERAAAFAHSLGIAYPIWIDDTQRYGRAYESLGLPTTVIVDRSGTIVSGFDGALTLDDMRRAVVPMLGRT